MVQPGAREERFAAVAKSPRKIGSVLACVEHQLPEEGSKRASIYASKGQPCLETFLITSGECTVEEGKSDDETGKIMRFRRASNLVRRNRSDAENVFGIGQGERKYRGGLVFTKDDIAWANKRDYRLTQDFNNAIRERRRVVAKYEARLRNIAKQKERTETRHQSEFVRTLRSLNLKILLLKNTVLLLLQIFYVYFTATNTISRYNTGGEAVDLESVQLRNLSSRTDRQD